MGYYIDMDLKSLGLKPFTRQPPSCQDIHWTDFFPRLQLILPPKKHGANHSRRIRSEIVKLVSASWYHHHPSLREDEFVWACIFSRVYTQGLSCPLQQSNVDAEKHSTILNLSIRNRSKPSQEMHKRGAPIQRLPIIVI